MSYRSGPHVARRWGESLAKRVEPWVVTDEFWRRVEPLTPVRLVASNKIYLQKPGAGRSYQAARLEEEGAGLGRRHLPSGFNRFRKLLAHREKLERSFVALNHLAAAIIGFRKVPAGASQH